MENAKLIEDTLPLVEHVVYQVSARFPRHVDRDELALAGVLGLVQAAHRFDPDKGVAFHHFAARRIRGAILDSVRRNDWAPRSVRRAGRSIEATSDRLAARLGRTPTSAEVAAELGLSVAELADLQCRLAGTVVLGLERIILDVGGDDNDDVVLSGAVPASGRGPDDELVDRELHAYLRDAVELLPERHRFVIRGYFFEGRSSEELAGDIGVSVSRISQLRTEAFEMMRDGLAAQYRDTDLALAPVAGSDSRRADSRRQAYAAAIAGQRPWRRRLDAA